MLETCWTLPLAKLMKIGEQREASRSTRTNEDDIPRKEHGKTYVLSGDWVASVLTDWGQLFVRRWRCIGKPYRSIQSICTAVHDELELHSTTLNLEALVSEGFFTFQATLLLPLLRIPIVLILEITITIPPLPSSSAQRFFGERFGGLFEREGCKSDLVRASTMKFST